MRPDIPTSKAVLFFIFAVSFMLTRTESFVLAQNGGASSGSRRLFAAAINTNENQQGECEDKSDKGGAADSDESVSSLPQLPAGDDPTVPVLTVGESMRFEELGPVIINLDGTTRRIDNWDQMTEHERKVTWRRISKRKAERRAMLEEKMRAEAEQSAASEKSEEEDQ